MRVGIGLRNGHLVRRRATLGRLAGSGLYDECPMPRPSALASVALVVAVAASACSPAETTPRPSGTPTSGPTPTESAAPSPSTGPLDPVEAYAAIEDQIAAIRELAPTAALTPTTLDQAELEQNLRAEYDRDNAPEDIAKTERLLVALGLLEPGTSLRDANLDLFGGQVAGYYSPADDALFVVSRSGTLGVTERATFAHEYVHALQDQHFDLEGLGIDDATNGDRAFAIRSLVEGDATIAQTEWLLAHLSREELLQLAKEASDPAALAVLARAPAILREFALFPYQAGSAFAGALRASGGWPAVDAAYADPPASTEQLIHPERYLERDPPTDVAFDAAPLTGAGWSVVTDDTMGEFLVDVWLREGGVRAAAARASAAGWDGDRVVLADGPGGASAVVLRTTWDSPADAAEFAAAVEEALDGYAFDHVVIGRSGSAEVVVIVGPDPAPAIVRELLGI